MLSGRVPVRAPWQPCLLALQLICLLQTSFMASSSSTPQSALAVPAGGQLPGASSSHSPTRQRAAQPNMARAVQQQLHSASLHENLGAAFSCMGMTASANAAVNRASSPPAEAVGGVVSNSTDCVFEHLSKARVASQMRQQQRYCRHSLHSQHIYHFLVTNFLFSNVHYI